MFDEPFRVRIYDLHLRQEPPKKKFLLRGEYKLKEKYYEKC